MASPKASEARPSCLVSAKPSRHTGQAQTASATRAAAASAQNTITHVHVVTGMSLSCRVRP